MIIYNTNNAAIIHIDVDDTSYSYREIMEDNKLYLEFALTQHVELPIGAYVDFQGSRFTLMSVSDVTIQHNRDYEYKVTFEGPEARFSKYRIHNPVDGRLVFEMTASPQEHLAMILANLVEREGAGSWAVGNCIDGTEITLAYNHTTVKDGLTQLANACDTEWEALKPYINLCKVEYNSDSPLALGYGRNAGFKPGVGRTNYGETGQIERLYVQGGNRNISRAEYGSDMLLLPKGFSFQFDGEKFRYVYNGSTVTESGFNSSKAVNMVTDGNGFSVALDSAGAACNEESLDLSQIYPKRVGEVTGVRYLYDHQYLTWAELEALQLDEDEWLKVQVDIIDADIPASLDYAECLLANDQPLTVIFQTGMLAGREFSATFCKTPRMSVVTDPETGIETEVEQRPANRFELVRENFNGLELPNATFRPNASSVGPNDTYIVVNCYLPSAYICDKATFSGAEMEMLREAAKYLYQNKDIQLTFKGEVDDLYSKRNWVNVGGKLKVGGCVSFTHPQVQAEPLVTRITAIKQFINNPYSPEITLGNETIKGGLSSRLAKMGNQQARVLSRADALERYTRRSFRDAKETMEMIAAAAIGNFSAGINPITVQTMQMLVGDESLQFRYVTSKASPQPAAAGITYNASTHKLTCIANIIQHMTLGIDTVSSSHEPSEYKFWDIARFESPYLGDALAEKKYYLYAKCNKAAQGETGYQEAEYILSETAIAMNSVSGYYHLLVGILNSEYEGERSFVTLFGFTEVLPGRITTDKIVSSDGRTYFDLLRGIIGGDIRFLDNGTYVDIASKFGGVDSDLYDILELLIPDLQYQVDGKIETYYQASTNNPASSWSTADEKAAHTGDIWYKTDNNTAWRWNGAAWQQIQDQAALDALQDAADAAALADGKATVFVGSSTPVDPQEGDLWFKSASDPIYTYHNGAWVVFNGHAKESDYVYLRNALGNAASTEVGAGVVLSQVIGVKDDNSTNVIAGMNGSASISDLYDSEKGRLMIWAGATNLADAKNAVFKVWESGQFESNSGIIGGFSVTDEGMQYYENGRLVMFIGHNSCQLTNAQISGSIQTRCSGSGVTNYLSLAQANGQPLIRINSSWLATDAYATYLYLANGETICNASNNGWWSSLTVNASYDLLDQVRPTAAGTLKIPSFKLYYALNHVDSGNKFTIRVKLLRWYNGSYTVVSTIATRTNLSDGSGTITTSDFTYNITSDYVTFYSYSVIVEITGRLHNGMNTNGYVRVTTDNSTYGYISYGSGDVTPGVFFGANGMDISFGKYQRFQYVARYMIGSYFSSFVDGNIVNDYRDNGGQFEVSLNNGSNDSVGIRIQGYYDAAGSYNTNANSIRINLGDGNGWRKLVLSGNTLQLQ